MMGQLKQLQIEINEYLDGLRENGRINMMGAASYIMVEFNISRGLAKTYLMEWMKLYAK